MQGSAGPYLQGRTRKQRSQPSSPDTSGRVSRSTKRWGGSPSPTRGRTRQTTPPFFGQSRAAISQLNSASDQDEPRPFAVFHKYLANAPTTSVIGDHVRHPTSTFQWQGSDEPRRLC